jgi:hypothetical protein
MYLGLRRGGTASARSATSCRSRAERRRCGRLPRGTQPVLATVPPLPVPSSGSRPTCRERIGACRQSLWTIVYIRGHAVRGIRTWQAPIPFAAMPPRRANLSVSGASSRVEGVCVTTPSGLGACFVRLLAGVSGADLVRHSFLFFDSRWSER